MISYHGIMNITCQLWPIVLAQGGSLRRQLLSDLTIIEIAEKYNVQPLQIALAWTIRSNNVIAIPKAVKEEHVLANAQAATI